MCSTLLHAITGIKAAPDANWVPRVNIFAGKAASFITWQNKLFCLINDVAQLVNNDPLIGGKLKVVFIPITAASPAQLIIPAADLSEQISLARTEASGPAI